MNSPTQFCLSWLCTLNLMLACSAPTSKVVEREPSRFDHPQMVKFSDNELVVLNTAYDPVNWGRGYISLMDPDDLTRETRIDTHAFNPQSLQLEAGWMMIVETGVYDFSDFDHPQSTAPFGIELFTGEQGSRRSHQFIQLPQHVDNQPISAPIELRTIGSVTLITSGLFNISWRVKWSDIDAGLVERIDVLELESELNAGLGTVVIWNNHFVVTEFNQDRLYLIDGEADTIKCRVELGSDPEEMEGLQTPLVVENDLFVSFAFSGHIERMNLSALLNDCQLERTTLPVILGQVPNDLDLVKDEIWVTMSGENHILRVDRVSGEVVGQVVLPISSNPWSFDFNESRQLGAVSLWATDEIYLLDQDGHLRFRLNENIRTN